jgi:adenine/guanine phosphoribosyltransferase-like PRPP-binding protein
MNEPEVWSALHQGGAVQRTLVGSDGEREVQLTKYHGLTDPLGAEQLATSLAARLADSGATLVVVWEDIDDIVLGFVVGRQLDLPVLRTYNADGLVGHAGPLSAGARAVLVTDCVRDPVSVRAISALLERSSGSLLGVAALADAGLAGVTVLASLVSLRAPEAAHPGATQRG